jgi:hypothetical protein
MNIIKKIDQYNENSVYFCEPIKNTIMNDGTFIRILYSTPCFTLNGVYLLIPFNEVIIEKYFNKYKCSFNLTTHKILIDKIKILEERLLQKYQSSIKIPQYKIFDQIKNGNIKIFCDNVPENNASFILKISGIWETETHYGLTYKFIKINNILTVSSKIF